MFISICWCCSRQRQPSDDIVTAWCHKLQVDDIVLVASLSFWWHLSDIKLLPRCHCPYRDFCLIITSNSWYPDDVIVLMMSSQWLMMSSSWWCHHNDWWWHHPDDDQIQHRIVLCLCIVSNFVTFVWFWNDNNQVYKKYTRSHALIIVMNWNLEAEPNCKESIIENNSIKFFAQLIQILKTKTKSKQQSKIKHMQARPVIWIE